MTERRAHARSGHQQEYSTIRTETKDRVAILRFNRPEKLNPLSATTFREVSHYLDRTQDGQQEAEALVLTGEGRAFVAGADIDDYVDMGLAEYSAFQWLGRAMTDRIQAVSCPVIAAVNGYALGGGFEVALACDIIVASENATFGLPEAKLGLLPGGGGTQRPRAVGPYVAKRLILSGETMDAVRAYQLGIVTEVVPQGQALAAALNLAQKILACGPRAVRMGKRLIGEGLESSLATGLSLEMDSTAHLFVTADKQEGIQAFQDRRPPRFSGR